MPFLPNGSYVPPEPNSPAGVFTPNQDFLTFLTNMNAGRQLYQAPAPQNALAPPVEQPAAAPEPEVPKGLLSDMLNAGKTDLGSGFSLGYSGGNEYGQGAGWMVLDQHGQPHGTYQANTPLQQLYAELPQIKPGTPAQSVPLLNQQQTQNLLMDWLGP